MPDFEEARSLYGNEVLWFRRRTEFGLPFLALHNLRAPQLVTCSRGDCATTLRAVFYENIKPVRLTTCIVLVLDLHVARNRLDNSETSVTRARRLLWHYLPTRYQKRVH